MFQQVIEFGNNDFTTKSDEESNYPDKCIRKQYYRTNNGNNKKNTKLHSEHAVHYGAL